jgi:hypothetical protein
MAIDMGNLFSFDFSGSFSRLFDVSKKLPEQFFIEMKTTSITVLAYLNPFPILENIEGEQTSSPFGFRPVFRAIPNGFSEDMNTIAFQGFVPSRRNSLP